MYGQVEPILVTKIGSVGPFYSAKGRLPDQFSFKIGPAGPLYLDHFSVTGEPIYIWARYLYVKEYNFPKVASNSKN